jgi:hypothetical protein
LKFKQNLSLKMNVSGTCIAMIKKQERIDHKETVMKALVLSLVIALSGSFAFASCPLASANVFSSEGALTKSSVRTSPSQVRTQQVSSVRTNGLVK